MNTAIILQGDARHRLASIETGSVQACITSPPYWGLRDYGTATWHGGDESCDHLGKPMATKANINRNCGTGNDVKNALAREFFRDVCGKCGAVREDEQLGLEATPDEYVANMVAVFREVHRVLAPDGVLWLNLGDSYIGYKGDNYLKDKSRSNLQSKTTVPASHLVGTPQTSGLKQKDLVGIPWRVAFALQADGWYLRQDIIWHKPNPMPESVTDRCTKSHEYLFMLTKSARYYFDNEAIKEPAKWQDEEELANNPQARQQKRLIEKLMNGDQTVLRSQMDYKKAMDGNRVKGRGNDGNKERILKQTLDGRNKRSVWTIPTKPFKGAHFAVMPEELVEPCVMASTKRGDLVLDPFTGSGTVAVVATKAERNFIGTELNPEYVTIAIDRITQACGMLVEVTVQ